MIGDGSLEADRAMWAFKVDDCRNHKRHADANFSLLRETAVTLLKSNKLAKAGVEDKRIAAARDEDYLLELPPGK